MVVDFGVFDVTSVQVIVKLQENFANLSVEQFLKLYKAFLIWPTWVSCLSHVYCTRRIRKKGLSVCMLNQSPPFCLSPLDLCPNALPSETHDSKGGVQQLALVIENKNKLKKHSFFSSIFVTLLNNVAIQMADTKSFKACSLWKHCPCQFEQLLSNNLQLIKVT